MTFADLPPAELVRRCLEVETEAWEAFVARYGPFLRERLGGVLRGRGRAASEADIDDAVSGVWEELLKDSCAVLRRWDGRRPLETFLLAIAAYRWGDVLRSEAARRERERTPSPMAPEPGAQLPSKLLEDRERSEKVRRALNRLPAREQFALAMFYREEWPHARIARALRLPVNHVGPLLARGRDRLRDLLRDIMFLAF